MKKKIREESRGARMEKQQINDRERTPGGAGRGAQ